jgi:short subunit dehydrogenase-like uncharacterized protein
MRDRLLVYGATGYTGGLLAALACERGLAPIVAGRSRAKVEAVAARLGTEARVASVDDAAALAEMLHDVACVISSAGPFATTARQMFEACCVTGAHYLDVTGEIDVFALAESFDARARRAGVMLLPGIGFDVVPSDCLAAHVAAKVGTPRAVRIGLAAGGTPTHGCRAGASPAPSTSARDRCPASACRWATWSRRRARPAPATSRSTCAAAPRCGSA